MTAGIQDFDFSVDLLRAILWQYNDALNLQGILQQKQDWYQINQTEFWTDWYNNVFNLDTANAFGLVVWSIILDIPIVVSESPPIPDKVGWGYDEEHANFTHGNFDPGTPGNFVLNVTQARQLLKMRYFQITTRGAVTEINQFMNDLFSAEGPMYVIDNLDMTATYVFEFFPSAAFIFFLTNFDILPRPAGVEVNYIISPPT